MAALKVVDESPNQLVLGVPLAQRLPNLLSLVFFVLIGFTLVSQLFEGNFGEDPGSLVVLLFFGFFGLRSVYSLLVTDIVKIDGTARIVSRSTSILGARLRGTDLPFNNVRRIVVGSRAPMGFGQAMSRGGWMLTLETTNGPALVMNWNGSHDEMVALGNKAAGLMNLSLSDEAQPAADAPVAQDYKPIQDFGGGATSTYAPPVAFPSMMGRSSPASQLPEKIPPANTLPIDSESPEHSRFEEEANQSPPSTDAGTDLGQPALSTTYNAPPAMDFPSQPPMEGAGPVPISDTDVPSSLDVPAASKPLPKRSIQELQKAIADDPTDSVSIYQLGRALHARGAYDQAMDLYQNAVRLDPMNGSMQNDLGALYYQKGKLKEAELAYRRSVGLDPFSVSNHYNLGILFAKSGRRMEAEQEFNRVQQNAGSDAERRLASDALSGRMTAPILSSDR